MVSGGWRKFVISLLKDLVCGEHTAWPRFPSDQSKQDRSPDRFRLKNC